MRKLGVFVRSLMLLAPATTEAKPYLRALISDPDQNVASEAKRLYAFTHFGTNPPQKDILPPLVDDSLQWPPEPIVGPWRLILPPMPTGKIELNADYSHWWMRFGFDTEEQCEYGADYLRKSYHQEPYLHGKCVPAAAISSK